MNRIQYPHLTASDPTIANLIANEEQRQENELNLIASENYTHPAIREATASVLTNKYAEGYPGRRYYGGCQFVDEIEKLAIERCKTLFGAEHANVQAHSGSQANLAVYAALLQPGDTLMGMNLVAGGHLTHGHPVNFSGMWYRAIQYGVDPVTEHIDYDGIEKLAREHRPKLIIAGASAYSRFIDFKRLGTIARSINAYLMVDIAHIAGLVAAGIHPSPISEADFITSTTHKTLRGPRGGFVLCKEQHRELLDRTIMPGMQGGPLVHVIAAKAVAFKLAQTAEFKAYQRHIVTNAQALAEAFDDMNYRIVSGGTDNHLFIIDLSAKKMNGRTAETVLAQAGISVSRSCIPFDTEKPWLTSGIRLGTPAVTTRGMGVSEMNEIAELVHTALANSTNDVKLAAVNQAVRRLCKKFSLEQTFITPALHDAMRTPSHFAKAASVLEPDTSL